MAPTVLLIEDEPDLAHAMTVALTRAGYEVTARGTAREAIEVIGVLDDMSVHHVDVAVLDRGLPDMDGADLAARLRRNRFAGPIMVVSGYSGAGHDESCRAAGASDVLAKPFELAELVGRVAHLAALTSQDVATRR